VFDKLWSDTDNDGTSSGLYSGAAVGSGIMSLIEVASMELEHERAQNYASEVFKDAINREIFLGYEPRLRGLWLKKEANKLSTTSKGD
jgi:hypothetical protein